jgi:hypothetical protein
MKVADIYNMAEKNKTILSTAGFYGVIKIYANKC